MIDLEAAMELAICMAVWFGEQSGCRLGAELSGFF